ncbi:hypothetical protein [Alteromonas flava]|uniref:hypothetical protein n=1 Tax=Alteromonas flava TaxID=2048003 RepID=UPI000C28FF5F|nr:hypothetical protein [Alteromonas flava]
MQSLFRPRRFANVCRTLFALTAFTSLVVQAGTLEQSKRLHDRIAGVPADISTLTQMQGLLDSGDTRAAAAIAMQHPAFYSVTLKQLVTPWTNEEFDVFAPLNDYTATVIGVVRDDRDFREILTADLLYIAASNYNVPAYSPSNNAHYLALEEQGIDLAQALVATTQSSHSDLPSEATAGVMTTRQGARAFFKDGTNRAMLRFTLMNHLCTDLEGLKDTSLPPDRIRQDLSRSPGGDSRIFINSCVGCHSGMDPLAQAFAYYEYDYDINNDPEGENGQISYNQNGETDAQTGLRVQAKYWINANNFPFGFITEDDRWDNYWRAGINQTLGWSDTLVGFGYGAKSMGEELANSHAFAQCQVKKVFKNVCLRDPQDAADRAAINTITADFKSDGYQLKQLFAATAEYCMGE